MSRDARLVPHEGLNNDARLHDLLNGQRSAMLRQWIECAVGRVLHGRFGKILDGPTILFHPRLEIDLGMNGIAILDRIANVD